MVPQPTNRETAVREILEAAHMPAPAVRCFLYHYRRWVEGDRGMLPENEILPAGELTDTTGLERYRSAGIEAMAHTVILKLNGGLGTSMGLTGPKSLLPVRGGLSFLDLIARQVLSLRRQLGIRVPLLLMSSFRTEAASLEALAAYPNLPVDDLPLSFLQHRVPKILQDDGWPAPDRYPGENAWCPPGHGDLYTAVATSGLLSRLLDAGYRYAFVSNSDNLGAVADPSLLGHMTATGATFMMEVADRTEADRKGGHLCRLPDGRLALREAAQVPAEEVNRFQDITRHRHFNTNNLWIDLRALAGLLGAHDGFLPLATIVNRKTLDPRDPSSPSVVQLETAMGAAISLFPQATAIRVPRSRFSPVKTTNDLLAIRSDAYELTPDGRIVLHRRRTAPPTIQLDPRFYRLIDDFDRRFPRGVPSLLHCDSLHVEGNVFFGNAVRATGRVHVVAGASPVSIGDGTTLEGEVRLGA